MDDLKRVVLVIVVAIVLMGVVLSSLGVYYYMKINKPVKTVLERPASAVSEPTTTVKVPSIIKPFVDVISDIKGVECGDDVECFNEAVETCKKTAVVVYTPKLVQLREVLGEENGRCIVRYNNTAITDLAEDYWLGLTMTCKLPPEDVPKDFMTLESPDCTGPLWERLKPFLR